MALSRVERIRQEREELILEMEGKNKTPKDFKKIGIALAALAVTSVVVFFGIKLLLNENVDAKASLKKGSKPASPVITFKESYQEISAGDSFDLLNGVVFSDNKDSVAKLKKTLEISSTPEFDANKEGSYSIVYKVTDSDNHTAEKTREILVKSLENSGKSSILVEISYVEIEVGTPYDLKEGVSITGEDQTLLDQMKVTSTPIFNKNKVGEYNIEFTVKDSAGNDLKATKKVIVKAKSSTSSGTNTSTTSTNNGNNSTDKESPMLILDSLEQTISIGTAMDLKAAVLKTTDNVDANHEILATLKITSDPVFNSKKAGVYRVTYTVNDKAGNTRTKAKTITVK